MYLYMRFLGTPMLMVGSCMMYIRACLSHRGGRCHRIGLRAAARNRLCRCMHLIIEGSVLIIGLVVVIVVINQSGAMVAVAPSRSESSTVAPMKAIVYMTIET
eukprot:GHVU01233721.1.p1 GENE.GHVU01233721.1~~GHVU01233721.1.p1  ORF type:complete len:103 (+),score=0.17 GHVU01233721.1:432-740(+)